ncbi:MAG: PfkB family carbohydrate kinase [candidate division Zixibacteria bacterium]|nr:PfkB family carbohydrate kinase [candidate division Zixibacteria bacterium]
MRKSKTTERVDCLGLGIMPLDLLFEIDDYPSAGGKRNATALTIQGGGPVPNVLVGLQRLGHSTALITAVADDLAGNIGMDEVRLEGVDTRFIVWKATGQSLMAGGFVERGSGRRTIVLYREIHVKPRDVVTSKLPRPRIVHLDGRDLEACVKLALARLDRRYSDCRIVAPVRLSSPKERKDHWVARTVSLSGSRLTACATLTRPVPATPSTRGISMGCCTGMIWRRACALGLPQQP